MWNAEQQIFNLKDISVYRAISRVPGQKSSRNSAGTTNPPPKAYRDGSGREPMSIDGKSSRNVAQAAARGADLVGNYRDKRKSSLSSIASSSSASSVSASPSLQLLQPPAPMPTPVPSPSIGINSQARSPSFGQRQTPVLPQSLMTAQNTARPTPRPTPSTARPTPSTARPTPRPTPSTARPTPRPTPSTARPTARPTPSTTGLVAAQMQPPPPAAPSLRRRTMVPTRPPTPPTRPPTPPTRPPPSTPLQQIISPYAPSLSSGSSTSPEYVSASSSPLIQATPPTPLPEFNALNVRSSSSSSL